VDTTRLARATDAPRITNLQMENWRISHPEIARLLIPAEVQLQWTQAITNDGARGRVLVCERDHIMVGVAVVEFDGEMGTLTLLEVEPAARRQLVGARLLNAVADIAATAGCLQLCAWLTADQMAGKKFLESTGWVNSGASRTVSTDPGESANSALRTDQIEWTTALAP